MRDKEESGTARQMVRFVIVGVLATLIHWGLYTLIKEIFRIRETNDWGLTLAYSFGYAASLLINYWLSLRYTFHTQGSVGKGLGFVFSHAVNYFLHIALLKLFLWIGVGQMLVRVLQAVSPGLIAAVPLLGDSAVLLPLPIFFIVVPVNFLFVRFFLTYRRNDKPKQGKNDQL